MKTLLLILTLVILYPHPAGAQWYNRACGASSLEQLNQQQFDCLWQISRTRAGIGCATTLVGTAVLLSGGITMLAADPCCSSGIFLSGYVVFLTGVAIDILAVPAWIVWSRRKSGLKALNPSKETSGLHIQLLPSVRTPVNNLRPIPGITLRASF